LNNFDSSSILSKNGDPTTGCSNGESNYIEIDWQDDEGVVHDNASQCFGNCELVFQWLPCPSGGSSGGSNNNGDGSSSNDTGDSGSSGDSSNETGSDNNGSNNTGGSDSGSNEVPSYGSNSKPVITTPAKPCKNSTGLSGSDGCGSSLDAIERDNLFQVLSPSLNQNQADWIYLSADINLVELLNNFIESSTIYNQSENFNLILDLINYLILSQNLPDDNEYAQNGISVLIENPDANPFLGADCRSFEYAQPPGSLQKGCGVTDFDHTFYVYGNRPNGSPYYGEIDVNASLVYFTMPTFLTNGQAANLTAVAVTNAVRLTDLYYHENPDSTASQIQSYFNNNLSQQIGLVGGTISGVAPFPIPSPAPYLTSFFGASTDCN
jgi:hypothetical protein